MAIWMYFVGGELSISIETLNEVIFLDIMTVGEISNFNLLDHFGDVNFMKQQLLNKP